MKELLDIIWNSSPWNMLIILVIAAFVVRFIMDILKDDM